MNIVLENDLLKVEISTRGAEIMSVKGCDGTEFIWDGNPDFWSSRAIVLFPVCGGLKEGKYTLSGKEYSLTKHGFVRNMEFEVEKRTETSVTFLLTDTEETRKMYPFSFNFRVIFTLSEKTLSAVYSVENRSETDMYFSVGAHEGYTCPGGIDRYKVEFEEKETLKSFLVDGPLLSDKSVIIAKDTYELPLIYEYFAVDALIFRELNSRKLKLSGEGKEITVEFPDFDHLLLWTVPNAGFICIEPWCAPPTNDQKTTEDLETKKGLFHISANDTKTVSYSMEFN